MTDQPLPSRAISPEERERAVQRLGAHFAEDHIDMSELESRLDLVFAASSPDELAALEQDLPALRAAVEPARTGSTEKAPLPAPGAHVDPTRTARERDFMLAVMGGTERKGVWTPARQITVLAVMGGARLDFREAIFAEPVTQVTIFALMGGTQIIVPPGVRVESHGIAIMGGFGGEEPSGPASRDAPVVRLHGLALMGGVDIQHRFPGETEREAKRRIKAERKAKAELRARGS